MAELTRIRRNRTPSYHQGFARNASESAHPELWRSLDVAVVPALGHTGDTIRDYSRFARHSARRQGHPWEPTPSFGWSLHALVSGQYVRLGTNTALDAPAQFSLFALIRTELVGHSSKGLIGKRAASGSFGYMLQLNPSNRLSFFSDAATIASTTVVNVASTYYRLVGTCDGTTLRVYVNGIEEANGAGAVPSAVAENFNVGTFGNRSNVTYLGRIPVGLMWSRVLKSQEIQLLNRDPVAPFRQKTQFMAIPEIVVGGRIMSSLIGSGGLVSVGGLAGRGGGLVA